MEQPAKIASISSIDKSQLLTLKKSSLIALFGLILLRLFLDYAYGNIISDIYGYYNFNNNPSSSSFLISWLFLLSLSPLIIKNFLKNNLSSDVVTMLIIISLIPTTTMIAYNKSYSQNFVLFMYIYWLLLLILPLLIPTISISKIRNSKSVLPFLLFTILFCSSIIYTSWIFTGFRLHFGLMDVYNIRAEARGYQVPLLLGYITSAADNILPLILTLFLVKRKKKLAIIIAIIILLNFGITATKQILFLLFFSLIGYLFIKSTKVIQYAIWGIIGLVLLSIIEFRTFNTSFIINFSLFRIFFIPAKLHYIYYDYFSRNEFDYFRQTALKWLTDSPYKDNIQFLIGYEDIGDFAARANNGLFSDAYLNFGLIGVLIFPLIVVTLLKIVEGATNGLDQKSLFIIVVILSFVLLGMPITQALFSSGVFIMIIFLYMLPRNYKSQHAKQNIKYNQK